MAPKMPKGFDLFQHVTIAVTIIFSCYLVLSLILSYDLLITDTDFSQTRSVEAHYGYIYAG